MLFLLSFAGCEVVRVHVVTIQCALYVDTVCRVIPPISRPRLIHLQLHIRSLLHNLLPNAKLQAIGSRHGAVSCANHVCLASPTALGRHRPQSCSPTDDMPAFAKIHPPASQFKLDKHRQQLRQRTQGRGLQRSARCSPLCLLPLCDRHTSVCPPICRPAGASNRRSRR